MWRTSFTLITFTLAAALASCSTETDGTTATPSAESPSTEHPTPAAPEPATEPAAESSPTPSDVCIERVAEWADNYVYAERTGQQPPSPIDLGLETPEFEIAREIQADLSTFVIYEQTDLGNTEDAGEHFDAAVDTIVRGCEQAY